MYMHFESRKLNLLKKVDWLVPKHLKRIIQTDEHEKNKCVEVETFYIIWT